MFNYLLKLRVGNINFIKKSLKNVENKYLNDIIIVTQLCREFDDLNYELLDFKYINNKPVFITNEKHSVLTGNGFDTKKIITILETLPKEFNTIYLKIPNEDKIIPFTNLCKIHYLFEDSEEKTQKIKENYVLQLFI